MYVEKKADGTGEDLWSLFYGHAVKRNGFHVKTALFVLFKPLNALKSAILRKKAVFSGFIKIFIRLLVRFIKN